jgi:tRNA (mo5U34)-methyltransferase
MVKHAELRKAVSRHIWVHSIDLGKGIVTPGIWGPPNPMILGALGDIDFTGKKVLDIGCWDGLWSFEAERRGAREVVATDCVAQRWGGTETFELARDALSSRVRYLPNVSISKLDQQLLEKNFDVVIFCGIFYHLKNPLLALAQLRKATREGGVLLVEGDVIALSDKSHARFMYRDRHHRDPSNWWLPTTRCLREWIECSYFQVLKEYRAPAPSSRRERLKRLLGIGSQDSVRRHALIARAVCRRDANYMYLDEDLRDMDPGPDLRDLTNAEAMRMIGLDEALIHAFFKTGYFITKRNVQFWLPEEREEWERARREWREMDHADKN